MNQKMNGKEHLNKYTENKVDFKMTAVKILTSRTANPTVEATGLPPNVLKCKAAVRVLAMAGVVTTAAIG